MDFIPASLPLKLEKSPKAATPLRAWRKVSSPEALPRQNSGRGVRHIAMIAKFIKLEFALFVRSQHQDTSVFPSPRMEHCKAGTLNEILRQVANQQRRLARIGPRISSLDCWSAFPVRPDIG